jgi:hypothetical protein
LSCNPSEKEIQMNSRKIATVLLALAVGAALAACGGDDGSTTETAAQEQTGAAGMNGAEPKPAPKQALETIVVRDGAPVGGPRKLEFDAGEEIRFAVRSDAADDLHVHGYEVEKELRPGKTTTISFPAELEGIFEVELHGSDELVAELQVNP